MRLEELQRPIGEIFTDDTFKAFVYDFYQTLPDIDDIPAIGDIYRHILSDENIYREFMQYCKKNNFSFTEIDNGISPTLAIHLCVFQSLRTVVIDKIQGLLHTPQEEFYH